MATPNEILKEAMMLSPMEKAELVDKLILALDKPDAELDKLWADEVESRLAAYKKGELKAISVEEVLSKRINILRTGKRNINHRCFEFA